MSIIPSVLRPWIAGDGLCPEVAPDWSYWFGLPEWSVWEASFLLLGWIPPPEDDPRYGVSFRGTLLKCAKPPRLSPRGPSTGFKIAVVIAARWMNNRLSESQKRTVGDGDHDTRRLPAIRALTVLAGLPGFPPRLPGYSELPPAHGQCGL